MDALYREAGQVPDWTRTGPGSLREQVRDQALSDTALCAIVDAWTADWGLELTEDDQARLDALWQERAAAHGGEEAYSRHLAQQGLTPEQARHLAETGQRYQKLCAAALDPENPHAPTPSELSAFAEQEGFFTVDQIRTTGENARQRIEALFAALNAAPDGAAVFPQLARQGDSAPGPLTCRRGDGTLPASVEEAGILLKPGQHSGILVADDGFVILLCLLPDRCALVPKWLDYQLTNAVKSAEIFVFPELSIIDFPVLPNPAAGKIP